MAARATAPDPGADPGPLAPSAAVRLAQVRAREAEPAQSGLHLRNAHEQPPQQPRAMVLHHHDDGPLIDGDVGISVPAAVLAESICKTVSSPELFAMLMKKMAQRTHDLARCVRQAGKSGGR